MQKYTKGSYSAYSTRSGATGWNERYAKVVQGRTKGKIIPLRYAILSDTKASRSIKFIDDLPTTALKFRVHAATQFHSPVKPPTMLVKHGEFISIREHHGAL